MEIAQNGGRKDLEFDFLEQMIIWSINIYLYANGYLA